MRTLSHEVNREILSTFSRLKSDNTAKRLPLIADVLRRARRRHRTGGNSRRIFSSFWDIGFFLEYVVVIITVLPRIYHLGLGDMTHKSIGKFVGFEAVIPPFLAGNRQLTLADCFTSAVGSLGYSLDKYIEGRKAVSPVCV